MENKIIYLALAILLVLAVLGKSAVMGVSVLGMGLLWSWKRSSPVFAQVGASAIGAVFSAVLAEVVHTVYHRLVASGAAGDTGGFFFGAVLVALVNTVVFSILLLILDWRSRSRPSQH